MSLIIKSVVGSELMHIVALDGLSVSLCALTKEFDAITDSSILFEAHLDNITRTAIKKKNYTYFTVLSLHDAAKFDFFYLYVEIL